MSAITLADRLLARRVDLVERGQQDAVQQGLIKIEGASFATNFKDLVDTHRVGMRVTLIILGERRTFTPSWDFDLTIRENLKPVIDQILRERGII